MEPVVCIAQKNERTTVLAVDQTLSWVCVWSLWPTRGQNGAKTGKETTPNTMKSLYPAGQETVYG